jgi:hypothetical protein
MQPTVQITLDMPQNLYEDISYLSGIYGKPLDLLIVELLDSALNTNREPSGYPIYPLGPAPTWENSHS